MTYYNFFRSGLNPDGTRQPWSVYNYIPCLTNRQAHRFAREDRQIAPSDLIVVKPVSAGIPKAPIGQCSSLVAQFTPPYPISC